MERKIKYDMLKYELFEKLLPGLLYTGSDEERLSFMEEMETAGDELIFRLYQKMCEEDGVKCPFFKDSFLVHRYERGGIHCIVAEIPDPDIQFSHALRSYIFYLKERQSGTKVHWRYFLIKRFCDKGHIHILHIQPDLEVLLGDEISAYENDRESEWKCMVRRYLEDLTELG